MVRLFCCLLVFCTSFLWVNNAQSAHPGCPPISMSDPCTTPWSQGTLSVTYNTCNADLYYCYRLCTSGGVTSMQMIYAGGDFYNQPCWVGVTLDQTWFNFWVNNMVYNAFYFHVNPSDIPPCGGTPPNVSVSLGVATCYRMEGDGDKMQVIRCDDTQIACVTTFTVCKNLAGSIIVTRTGSTVISSEPCGEPEADWLTPNGPFSKPCMRICN